MFVVVVSPNKDGKIELSKEELQKMLNDAYDKGYAEGKPKSWDTITVLNDAYDKGYAEGKPKS